MQQDRYTQFSASQQPTAKFETWQQRKAAIEQHARQLMQHHNLSEWRFGWDKAKARIGACHGRKKMITLSEFAVPHLTLYQVHDVILHEIAHALVGVSEGHNHKWKAMARKIGCSADVTFTDDINIEYAYTGTCPNCNLELQRHRITKRSRRSACTACCNRYNRGKYDERFKIQWKCNR